MFSRHRSFAEIVQPEFDKKEENKNAVLKNRRVYHDQFLASSLSDTYNCNICVKVFKDGPSKICGRQSLKNLSYMHITSKFLKAAFQKFYLTHS